MLPISLVTLLLNIMHLIGIAQGTSYRYFTSLEDAKCTAEGEPAYMGILKRSFCSVQVAGRECENDKFCGEGEICLCNTKCQSYRCIKGKRKEDKPTVEGNNGGWNSTKNTTEGALTNSTHASDNCFPNPCENNGTCGNLGKANYTCNCTSEYEGKQCESKKCTRKCEAPGVCIHNTTEMTEYCGCKTAGLTGVKCETDINECEIHKNICHSGICNNTRGSYKCICNKFWTSSRCDKMIDSCANVDCGNGTCIQDLNKEQGYICKCPLGLTGKYCEKKICKKNPCQNGGKCVPMENGTHKCECNGSYTGKHCEVLNPCTKNPCKNGGKCTRVTNTFFKCNCNANFTGDSCQNVLEFCPIENCQTRQCDPLCNRPSCPYVCPEEDPFKNCDQSGCEEHAMSNSTTCRKQCNSLKCLFDGGQCLTPEKKCRYEELCQSLYNDGACDSFCNVRDCGFDIDCFQEPKLEPGKLVIEVAATEEEFKKKEVAFERALSKTLNSLATVQSVNKLRVRVRRSTTATNESLLAVSMTMDNSKCTEQCFSVEQGARYLALKVEQGNLNIPVRVMKIRSEPSNNNPEPSGMPLFLIVIVVAGSFLTVGMLYKGKTIATRLWRTDEDPGQRQTPIGQEMRNCDEGESPSSKRPKMSEIGRMDSTTTPFLSLTQNSTTLSIHSAAQYGYANIVAQLMDNGVDVNKRDANGRTALHTAVSVNSANVFYLLIRNRHINPDLQDNNGDTPLMLAVNVNPDFVRQLVSLGSRVSLANRDGKTALHLAAMYNNREAAVILISHNAKVDAQDNQSRTPLYLACKEVACSIVALLLQHYANRAIADVDDVTPLMIAKREKNQELIMLLSDTTQMIPSPLSSISGEAVSPYQDIRPKPGKKRSYQQQQQQQQNRYNKQQQYIDPLREMPDWAVHPLQQQHFNQMLHQQQQTQQQQQQQQQQQTFNFTNGSPFEAPSPGVRVLPSELSPFSDSIPNIMTPPLSWTTSPQSLGGDEETC